MESRRIIIDFNEPATKRHKFLYTAAFVQQILSANVLRCRFDCKFLTGICKFFASGL